MASFFRTQKLLIQVLPDAGEAAQRLQPAADCGNCHGWLATVFSLPVLPILPLRGDPSGVDAGNPASLLLLKAQLREALAQVEAQEQAINEKLRPQTLEEAQALETFLTDALAEVGKQKEALQNKDAEDTGESNG